MPQIFSDNEILARLDASTAVAAMRAALLAAHAGTLQAPPRVAAQLGTGQFVFTAGRVAGSWLGFRAYETLGLPESEQVVVLQDEPTGRIRAIAIGSELGNRRTGAIGGAAVDALARPDAATLGVVGTGRQAWTQVWAVSAARRLREVSVFSRTPSAREDFAARIRAELGIEAQVAPSTAAAVKGRDIVLLATSSPTPVIAAGDISPGTHVTTVGPKQRGRAEFDTDLAARAAVLVTDSLAQIAAYQPPMLLAGTADADRMVALGAVIAGDAPGRRSPDDVTMFCSVGLAGTEVFLLDALTDRDG
jgi:ornithine cyclodeaminase